MVRLDRLKAEQESEDGLPVLELLKKKLHRKFRVIRCYNYQLPLVLMSEVL